MVQLIIKGSSVVEEIKYDFRVMVSWFKQPGDDKMPSSKELLCWWYEQTHTQNKNDRTYLKPGEITIVDGDDEQDSGIDAPGEWM